MKAFLIRHIANLSLIFCLTNLASADIGDPVTEFSLRGLDGQTYNAADYKGKVLILFFMGHS